MDARGFGSQRRNHRQVNNRLNVEANAKTPSLFPEGSSKDKYTAERKGDGKLHIPLLDDNEPEHISLYSSSVELDKENQVEAMVVRITTRAFEKTGVFQSVFNVDSGEVEENVFASKREDMQVYKAISTSKGLVRDIVGTTLGMREAASSLDVLEVVKPFVYE